MKSIFDLRTKNSDLSSANQGLANYKYQELTSLRNVQGGKFPDGEITFRWSYGSNKYWIPCKSYVKATVRLTKADGSRLTMSDNLTWGMNTVPLLFQSSQYKIADQTVCSVTQNLAQVDTLKNRMYKSDGWLQSAGQSLNNWSHSYKKREQNMFSAGGNDLNGAMVPFYKWADVVSELTILPADSISIVADAVNGGNDTYVLTLTDSATSGQDWRNLGLQPGDVIWYVTNVTAPTGNTNRSASSGVITEVDALTITFIPHNGASVLPNAAISTSNTVINFLRHDFYDEDGSLNAHEVELFWKPTLSVFDSVKHAMPCGATKQEFTLTPYPDSVYQKSCIESRGSDKQSGVDFKMEVLDLRFYILTCDSNRIEDNFDFLLDLNEIQCQSTPITSTNQEQSLDVISSTNGISMAFQDSNSLNSTLYSLSKFRIRDKLELNLTRYYIRYEYQAPQPDGKSELVLIGDGNTSNNDIGKRDLMKDFYVRTKIYDGTLNMEQPESLEVYRNRGMYIYHPFPKTSSSKNTRVYVQVNFSSLTDNNDDEQEPFLLIFSHYKKIVKLSVVNGRIVGVLPVNA
jgi:hypothetical protein